ncbi:MAG: hypothetical protein AMXMBFR33_60330 [Candidatus Xenobia bacterium]
MPATAKTLTRDPDWDVTFLKYVHDPNTKWTVSIAGLEGNGLQDQVMNAVRRGIGHNDGNTNWEIYTLWKYNKLPEVNFVDRTGKSLPNPWR